MERWQKKKKKQNDENAHCRTTDCGQHRIRITAQPTAIGYTE